MSCRTVCPPDQRQGSDDQRVVHLYLTPAGEEALAASDEVLASRLEARLSRLDPAEVEVLLALLGKLADPPACPSGEGLSPAPPSGR